MPHMAGGYHYDFVPDVPLNYICVSCNFPLRKPHQISTCGHQICLQCFQNIKQESEESNGELLCPFDDENIDGGKVYPDIAVEKELLNWNVKCVNHINYCLWVGPLKDLGKHQVSCNKDTNENNLSEPEFITKADFEMVFLKLHSLESRIEAYESKIVYYEQKMQIINTELASCKAMLLEKCKKLEQETLLVDGKKSSVTNREGKIEITDATNKDLNESSTINESQTRNDDNQTLINGIVEKNSHESKSEIHDTIPKKQTDRKENSTHGSNNTIEDVANNEVDAMNTENTMPNNFNQTYLWEPKDILKWGKANITLLSPQFNHKGFRFQFKIKNTGDNIIFTFCHTKNQVLAGYKCTVLFSNKSGVKRPFKFDVSEAKEKSKTLPGVQFTKHFMDIETKIYIEFSA